MDDELAAKAEKEDMCIIISTPVNTPRPLLDPTLLPFMKQ
jgi:hypothetical protein